MHVESVADHSFQTEGPETTKLRCPYVNVLVQGTSRSPCNAERRKRRPVLGAFFEFKAEKSRSNGATRLSLRQAMTSLRPCISASQMRCFHCVWTSRNVLLMSTRRSLLPKCLRYVPDSSSLWTTPWCDAMLLSNSWPHHTHSLLLTLTTTINQSINRSINQSIKI